MGTEPEYSVGGGGGDVFAPSLGEEDGSLDDIERFFFLYNSVVAVGLC
jgi:hypothetical protein